MNDPLLSLTPAELRNLAESLKAGRLGHPYSNVSLQRFVSRAAAENVAGVLAEMSSYNSTDVIARTMELLAGAFEARPPVEDLVDVVTSGPGLPDSFNRSTSVILGDLFRNANHSVIVAGYAVHQGQTVFSELAKRMGQRPDMRVRLYLNIQRKFGDTSRCDQLERDFAQRFRTEQWPPKSPLPEIYYDEQSLALDQGKCASLHAKCVVADDRDVFVSSANFTEAAQIRNIEVGVLLHSNAIAGRITQFFNQLHRVGVLKRLF